MPESVVCGGLDVTKIGFDDLISMPGGEKAWVKAQVLDKVYNIDGIPHAVIQFNDACLTTLCNDNVDFNKSLMLLAVAIGDDKTRTDESIPSGLAKSICGAPIQDVMKQAQSAVDYNNTNNKGFFPAAVKPVSAVIPVRSNVRTYGPYVTPNFASLAGGVNVEVDTDIAPWVFGSLDSMHQAANIRLQSVPTNPLAISETGSATFIGLPAISLGGSNATGGPNLTGINVSFGSSGVTTSYSFQTYTPKFGSLSRAYLDRIKTIVKYNQEQRKLLKNEQINVNKINRRLAFNKQRGEKPKEAEADKGTLQRILVGEIYDYQKLGNELGQRTVVGTSTLPKSIYELRYDYDKKAFMSLDGLFGPVSVKGDGELPRYATHTTSDHKSSPIEPLPPFANDDGSGDVFASGLDQHNLEISQKYQNPVTNPGDESSHYHEGNYAGHVIDALGRPSGTLDNGFIMNFYDDSQKNDRYTEDYRFLGLRGPLVLHAWGYDTQGKPIPNASDNVESTKTGEFTSTGLKDRFLKDWLHKPATWPVAPVDLRFDRERGLWVSPPGYRVVVAKLKEDLEPYGTAKAQLVNKNSEQNQEYGKPIYDKDGEEVTADESDQAKAIIKIVDRIGQKHTNGSLIYAYYDTFKSEYIVLSAGETTGGLVRFKLVNLCVTPPNLGDNPWLSDYGYGDKIFLQNNEGRDSYALRLNCNRQPIDKEGNILSDSDLADTNTVKSNLIIVRDVCGQWGPSFNALGSDTQATIDDSDIQRWKQRAAEGYGIRISDPQPSGTEGQEPIECMNKLPCELTYVNESGETVGISGSYDILFLESYARVIHGCLKQDLYCSATKAQTDYAEDSWKKAHPSGNAVVEVVKYYGNSPNGNEPYYMDSQGEPVQIRCFDPWYNNNEKFECHEPKQSQFFKAKAGTPVTAIFNEKTKQYDIIQISHRQRNAIRFKLIDKCSASFPQPNNPKNDDWFGYAGYMDKWPNNHILGVRIDCDGQPVDSAGNPITEQDLNDPNKKEDIFVNLYDTAGSHGPAFAAYKTFNEWKEKAFTGFAVEIETPSSGTCGLGQGGNQCSSIDSSLDSYDILFLESYARFVECTLEQDLYPSEEKLAEYADDSFKSAISDGNAKAAINNIYGGSPNIKEPKFYDVDGDDIPFRVFDPFSDGDKEKSPFKHLKSQDKVLAVFDETLKKYIIYQSSKDPSGTNKVVKFALVDNKDIRDRSVRGVLVDKDGVPIDTEGNELTEENFNENIIDLSDPFVNRIGDIPGQPSSFGPALGGSTLQEHLEGIVVSDGDETGGHKIEKLGPFIGFASFVGGSGTGVSVASSGYYEIIQLEKYADLVVGKIGTVKEQGGFYYGARAPQGFANGVAPVTRQAVADKFNLRLNYPIPQSQDNYIVGDIKESGTNNGLYDSIDGCRFIARIDNYASDFQNGNEKLCYTIIEAEHIAKKGQTTLKKQSEAADQLNGQMVNEDENGENISSVYDEGFQWSKSDSPTKYKGIKIYNRDDWMSKPYLVKNSIVYTRIAGLEENGSPFYRVLHGDQVAHIMEKSAKDGSSGCQPSGDDAKVKGAKLYQGNGSIANLDGQEPGWTLGDNKWMTYEGSPMVGVLDETSQAAVAGNASMYRIIYAREAPVIITGKAKQKFTPTQNTAQVEIPTGEGAASCPGGDKQAITQALISVENPMGYGAETGDYVVVQRKYTGSCGSGGAFKYSVIGTGAAPGTCGGGGNNSGGI